MRFRNAAAIHYDDDEEEEATIFIHLVDQYYAALSVVFFCSCVNH